MNTNRPGDKDAEGTATAAEVQKASLINRLSGLFGTKAKKEKDGGF